MAVKSYDEFLKWFQGLNAQQQQNFRNMTQNDATIQGYLQQYDKSNTVYTPNTTNQVMQSSLPTNSFWDTWGASNSKQYTGQGVASAWDYVYNPNISTDYLKNSKWLSFWGNAELIESRTPWYLEQRNNAIANALYNEWKTDYDSVYNYLMTFDDFKHYDDIWQKNTTNAILKRMWENQTAWWNLANQGKATSGADLNNMIQNEIMNNYNNAKNGYSDLMWWGANYYSNFWDAVNGKLKEAYWIEDLDAFKERYPDQYESLVKYLETIEPSRNATDPNERQMLDGKLQAIIGTGVWAGSDISKLKVLESSIMNKFVNPEQVKKDAENVIKLQTEWKSIKDIANQMWMSEDQVQQLVLLANWLDSKAWEYYQLTDKASKDITEPYDTKIARLEEEKKIALDRANRNVEWLKQDYDTNYERQTKQNQINIDNAHFIASMTWYWFSDWWIRWLQYTNEQAKNILDDLTKNYDRNNQEMADGIADIIRNWQWNNEDLTKACEDALNNAKNVYVSNQLAITQKYWTVWLEAQQQFANNVQSFIDQVQNIYDSWLQRQQNNLTNLINNVANLNALASNNLLLRQQRISQFQSESMNLNRNQLQSLASQLWMDPNNYQELVNYQAQAVANELNWYVPWAWMYFQQEIQSQLDQWYTPMQAMNNIMNSDAFKAMKQSSNWDSWSMSNWIMYNKSTWEYKDLNWNTWNKLNDTTLYNPATWQTMNVSDLWNIGWNAQNAQSVQQWLQNFANKYTIWSTGWQCWEFANKYLESLWLKWVFVDPIEDKKKAINTEEWYVPQVWDIAVMNSPSQPQYWHVAIITWISQDNNWNMVLTTLESNKKNNDWKVFTRTFTPNVNTATEVFWYYHPEVQWNPWMSNYDIDTATMRIGRMAYWANISNDESKRVERILRDWASMWKDQTEILYNVLWMKITNNKDKAEPFIDIMVQNSDKDWLSAYNVQWFSDFINKWQIIEAMNMVEQAVAKERWWNFASDMAWYENWAKYAYEKWNSLIDMINKESNKLWIVAGNISKWKSKFMEDENYQKIASAITNYVSDWRHEMLGSATTATELKMIDDLLPSVTDNPFNAITKIKEFQDYWLRKLNSTRWNLYLPALNEETLLNKKKRSNLYLYWDPWTKTLWEWVKMWTSWWRM